MPAVLFTAPQPTKSWLCWSGC